MASEIGSPEDVSVFRNHLSSFQQEAFIEMQAAALWGLKGQMRALDLPYGAGVRSRHDLPYVGAGN